jgi:hypothetical protein
MKNPFTGKDASKQVEEHVEKLREIRRNARKAARSGNPAKSAPARRVLDHVSPSIAAAFRSEDGR